jgi:hypothetical protein
MTEPERIKNIEENITLAVLLPGVNLAWLPPEESVKLKRAVLDLYKLSHARGFKAGADHAMASVIPTRRDASQMQWLKRMLLGRMREYWQDYKASLRSIRATIFRKFSEE